MTYSFINKGRKTKTSVPTDVQTASVPPNDNSDTKALNKSLKESSQNTPNLYRLWIRYDTLRHLFVMLCDAALHYTL